MDKERTELSKPPLNILLNPEEVRNKKPWEINILQLLQVFITILEKMDSPDLRLCGSAALSSAMIYRLKVESLFLFEKLIAKHKAIDRTEIPNIIDMPYRFELPTTSITDLVFTLETILQEMLEPKIEKPKISIIEVEPVLLVDSYSAQIQSGIADLKLHIASILREKEGIFFSEYVKDMELISKIRTLLMLLFIANEGLIKLLQEETDDDILIVSAGESSNVSE